jgi:hypothetical protein
LTCSGLRKLRLIIDNSEAIQHPETAARHVAPGPVRARMVAHGSSPNETSSEHLKRDAYDLLFVHRTFKSCTPHIPPDCNEMVLGE